MFLIGSTARVGSTSRTAAASLPKGTADRSPMLAARQTSVPTTSATMQPHPDMFCIVSIMLLSFLSSLNARFFALDPAASAGPGA